MASAWKKDPEFRSLVFLVLVTLVGGTIFFYSLEEGWSVVDAFYVRKAKKTLPQVRLGPAPPYRLPRRPLLETV